LCLYVSLCTPPFISVSAAIPPFVGEHADAAAATSVPAACALAPADNAVQKAKKVKKVQWELPEDLGSEVVSQQVTLCLVILS